MARAFALAVPLLVFLLLTLLVPVIVALLERAVGGKVANALPRTVRALDGWNRKETPAPAAVAPIVCDLGQQPDSTHPGALARRLNSDIAGARSLVMGTFRALPIAGTPEEVKARMLEFDAEVVAIARSACTGKRSLGGSRWTAFAPEAAYWQSPGTVRRSGLRRAQCCAESTR